MNQTGKIVVLMVGLLVLTVGQAFAAVVIGEQAPEFSTIDTSGQKISLSSYSGRNIVLEWFNHECPFIKKHYNSGNMQKLQKTYTQKGVVWLSICSSAPGKQGHVSPEEANQLTKDKNASPTAVILDEDGTIGRLYGAKTTPHMFIIDTNGKLVYQGAIDTIPGTDPDEIAEAQNYVEAILDPLLEGSQVVVPSTKSYGCSVKY